MLKHVTLRNVILLVALLATMVIATIFRRFGIRELAVLLGFFVLVFLVEAGVFVARRYLRGLRGQE